MRKRKRKKKVAPILVLYAALLVGIYFIWPSAESVEPEAPVLTEVAQTSFQLQPAEEEAEPEAEVQIEPQLEDELRGFPEFTRQVALHELTDTQYLKLVNREFGIRQAIADHQLVTVWPDIPARATDVLLHETANRAMQDLFARANASGVPNLFIASGFRDATEQADLFSRAIDRRYVMPAGHSEHQLGLAADILVSGLYGTNTMVGSSQAAWLAENAPDFGLVLRYPSDKEHITGVAYEPWHFRYVGRIHAWYMTTHQMVLEEYLAHLQEIGGFVQVLGDRTYHVLYQNPNDGMIFVPEYLPFHLSSTNTGGYLVWTWR